jgi:hypothetical protein
MSRPRGNFILAVAGQLLLYTPTGEHLLIPLGITDPPDCGWLAISGPQ